MNSNFVFNNAGRQVFEEGRVRSPRDSERSGSATTRANDKQGDKIRRYSVEVKGGELKISSPPRKVSTK